MSPLGDVDGHSESVALGEEVVDCVEFVVARVGHFDEREGGVCGAGGGYCYADGVALRFDVVGEVAVGEEGFFDVVDVWEFSAWRVCGGACGEDPAEHGCADE